MEKKLSLSLAGSTHHTVLCADAIFSDPRFHLTSVLTPIPKPIGRKQTLTKNPVHLWAEKNNIPVVLIEKKIDESIRKTINDTLSPPDLLLVVDFGYIVPHWLLDWPSVAPVNIHPSDLPKYRGSSPGQFTLLFGEKNSAVTLIVMDAKLDHGPIITKLAFKVNDTWTAQEYYSYAFDLVKKDLATMLFEFATSLERKAEQQPDESPTPVARQLTRDDGFVPYQTLQFLLHEKTVTSPVPFLENYKLSTTNSHLFNMWRALTPWPGLWTTIEVQGVEKRMKLLKFHFENEQLFLDEVQIEGKLREPFNSVKE